MTLEQKRKILKRIVALETDISTLKDVRLRLATAEFVSASMSSGNGSRSYTRADIGKITQAISDLLQELKNNRRLLSDEGQLTPNVIYTVYS